MLPSLLISVARAAGKGGAVRWVISGTINDSAGAGLDGVTITLSGDASDSTTTAGGGAYSFSVVDGSYTVTPTKSGSTFSPTSANVTVSGGAETATTMAQVWQITGTINDSAGSGLSGVTVTLSGDASDSDTTAGDGSYSFTGLSDGSYTVTPAKAGSTFSPASDNVSVSGANAAATTMAQVWEITGTVQDANDTPNAIEGVTITLTGDASDSTSTAADGTYTLSGISDGNYTVTPTKTGYTFTPTSSAVTVSGADQTGKNFAGVTFVQVVWNAEDLELNATDANTSYQVPDGVDDAKIQLDDYSDLDPLVGSPARDLDQCFQSDGTNALGHMLYLYMGVGNGFTPSDGGTVRIEAVMWTEGSGTKFGRIGLLSDDGQDGIRAELSENTLDVDTSTGGSWTQKGTFANCFASAPHGNCWWLMSFEYNFSTNAYSVTMTELGNGAATQESVTKSGTASNPTFGSNTEQHKVFCQVIGGNAVSGIAQMTCSDETTAFPNGYDKTANFTP